MVRLEPLSSKKAQCMLCVADCELWFINDVEQDFITIQTVGYNFDIILSNNILQTTCNTHPD
jgi:hypothetical protein